jgi:hypothetical protein
MKYLCVVHIEEKKLAAVSLGQPDALDDDECVAYDEALRKRGLCLASEALQPVETAITDGPFAETKEQLDDFG